MHQPNEREEKNMSKKSNEVMVSSNNGLATITANLESYAGKLGYEMLHTVRENDGKVAVAIYDKDGKEVCTSLENMSDSNLESLQFIESITNFDDVSPVLVAWHILQLRDFAEKCGFGSVGAFVSEQIHGKKKANYCNQLANVAEKFLEIKEGDTLPTFKYAWCEHVPVSNLALILGEYNKCGDEPTFRERFIECDDPLCLRNQNKLKEQLKEVRGTASKPKKSTDSGEQGEQGEHDITTLTAWAIVREFLLSVEIDSDTIDMKEYNRAVDYIDSIVSNYGI